MVVSGAPEKEGNHAERVCDMALDMVDAITNLKDPSTGNNYNNKIQFKFLSFCYCILSLVFLTMHEKPHVTYFQEHHLPGVQLISFEAKFMLFSFV